MLRIAGWGSAPWYEVNGARRYPVRQYDTNRTTTQGQAAKATKAELVAEAAQGATTAEAVRQNIRWERKWGGGQPETWYERGGVGEVVPREVNKAMGGENAPWNKKLESVWKKGRRQNTS